MGKKEIFPHELIGEEICVVDSTNKSHLGMAGKVVDETKSTIRIDQHGRTKVLLKDNITFKITRTGEILAGKDLLRRPEDRMKGK